MKKEGKKGGRLSLFGKRPDSKGGNAMTGSPGIFASVVDKR